MKRILFVTSRNVFTTGGEMRLIKNRAKTLYDEYQIATDFMAVAKESRILAENREDIGAGGNLTPFKISYKNIFSVIATFFRLKKAVRNCISSGKYSQVVLSGVGTHFLAKSIRAYSDIKLIVDCHGASEAELSALKTNGWLKTIWYRCISKLNQLGLKEAFKYCDSAFAVSTRLEQYMRERYKVSNEVVFYIVPCATTSYQMSNEEYDQNRNFYRKKYNIADKEIVFIYSGGVSYWQCIDETVELYEKIKKRLSCKSKMMIFSYRVDELKKFSSNESIILDSYTPEELECALCMGDYAFLIRNKSIINAVAFPNKFLEYVKSRMRIITTPYVESVAQQIVENDAGYIYDFEEDITHLLEEIEISKDKHGNAPEIIDTILGSNCFVNTLKKFVKEL